MAQAMRMLGFEKEDLNTKKRREHFRDDEEAPEDLTAKQTKAAVKQMTITAPDEIDEQLVSLRFKHYQHRLMDRINRVLSTRK